jgi:hypothetical protein
LADDPSDEVHPGHGSGERETRDDRVERLGLELLGDKGNGLGGRFHYECYMLHWENNYSNESFSLSTFFLNFFFFSVFIFEKSCSSSDESSLELTWDSNFLNVSSENDQASGSHVLITINSIF